VSNFSAFFIRRPVATTLLAAGIALAGVFAFGQLPVSPLPQVDFPTISVSANMAGASPDNMASSVASPLEKHLGQMTQAGHNGESGDANHQRVAIIRGGHAPPSGQASSAALRQNAAAALALERMLIGWFHG